MLRINDVFKLGQERYRILALAGQHAIWMNIDSDKAWPELVKATEIEQWILDESLRRIPGLPSMAPSERCFVWYLIATT